MPTYRALPVDHPLSAELLTEYFTSRELGFTGGKYTTVRPARATFEPPAGLFLVVFDGAEDGGDAVGCGGVRRIEPGPDGAVRYEVKHLWLQERTRGRGLGKALLIELERRAAELGAEEMVLDTNASLAAAAGLYAGAGYEGIEPYNDNPNATNWYAKRL